MKTIGLLGGMSWESTAYYYKVINELVYKKLGGYHSAKIIMYSVNFDEFRTLQLKDDWDAIAVKLIKLSKRLQKTADVLLLCTNTMHNIASELQSNIKIPLIHIADPTAEAIKEKKISTIGLLGTKITMEQDFYKKRLTDEHGISVIVPDESQRQIIDDIIFNELVLGQIKTESRDKFIQICKDLIEAGAEGIILGCTEIPLLIQQNDVSVPVFDTTYLHAKAGVEFILNS